MAKCLRSKWKRKMRAVRREKFGERELDRLKDMLTRAGDYQMVGEEVKEENETEESSMTIDEDECSIVSTRAATGISAKFSKNSTTESDGPRRSKFVRDQVRLAKKSRVDGRKSRIDDRRDAEDAEKKMSVDKVERNFSKRTMRDQFGNYPEWMNKRKMMTQKKKNKLIKTNRAISLGRKKK